jgi:hypothetical protein
MLTKKMKVKAKLNKLKSCFKKREAVSASLPPVGKLEEQPKSAAFSFQD